MPNISSKVVQPAPRQRALSLRQLLGEIHVLIGSFPDLHEASDPDELPIAFILRRDALRSTRVIEATNRNTPARHRVRYRRPKTLAPTLSWHGARSAPLPQKHRT